MKRVSLTSLALLGVMTLCAQIDPVLMTINNKEVYLSEFEYSFNKNNAEGVLDKKSIEEYVPLFVNYKLKVTAAEELKLDTMTSFKEEFRLYRDQQLRPLLVDEAAEEREIRLYYTRMQENIGPKGLIQPSHILVRLTQQATAEEQREAKVRIDSIYSVLQQGGDFATLAKSCSQDPGSAANGGQLPWIGPNQTLKEFEETAYSLQKGEMSSPFLTTAGYHIVFMNDRKPLENYEELRPQIQSFLVQRGLHEKLVSDKVAELTQNAGGSLTQAEVMDNFSQEVERENAEIRNLVREYYDGLLLYEVSNQKVWEKASKDEEGLAAYFKKHKRNYAWDSPRYKGAALYARNAADEKPVKKLLKSTPFTSWAKTVRTTFNKDSVVQVRMEQNIFKEGDNPTIDKLVFKKGEGKEVKDFPHQFIMGKMQKKYPESYTDVKGEVTSDYQNQLDEEWIKELRAKYTVVINEDVLKTVKTTGATE